jgi:hypothetical protein
MQVQVGSKHLIADIAVAMDVTGREHLVVVTKATWRIPEPGQRPKPIKPEPLVVADAFYGDAGESALRYGSDFARFKPLCDVLFDACAHSPTGKPVRKMDVQVQVGAMQKQVRVHGPRQWQRLLGVTVMDDAQPFTQMPLHHGLAYGGTRWYEKGLLHKQRLCESHLQNPTGLGFAGRHTTGQMHNQPAPSLEHPKKPVRKPNGGYAPVALSAIARHWSPRRELAGTYDEAWQRDVFPFLPKDFDERFNQVAPVDQQIPYPTGGEPVSLTGVLARHAQLRFVLPALTQVAVQVLDSDDLVHELQPCVDTLLFEPDAGRFSAVWRTALALRRNIGEVQGVAVGPRTTLPWGSGPKGGGCAGCEPAAGDPSANPMEFA